MIKDFNEKIDYLIKMCQKTAINYFLDKKDEDLIHIIALEDNLLTNNLSITIIKDSEIFKNEFINNDKMYKKLIEIYKKHKLVFSCIVLKQNNTFNFIFETPFSIKQVQLKEENGVLKNNKNFDKWKNKNKEEILENIVEYKPKLNIKIN